MRFLIGCPVPSTAVAGPATVARELERVFIAVGDEVRVVTFSSFERRLPIPLRHFFFFARMVPSVRWAERVILLDSASTGPTLAMLAHHFNRPSILRIGGDFLWESYVERTGQQIILPEFYQAPRVLSPKERWIRRATHFTLRKVTKIAFNTDWQRALWRVPYHLSPHRTIIIENALPERAFSDAKGKVFLSAARNHPVKNGAVMHKVKQLVTEYDTGIVFDNEERSPELYTEALRDCYAVVLPSLSDVAPNALYEAVRRGKPFVSTENTGVRESFKDFGIFVDTRSAEAIAQGIFELLKPERYAELRSNIQKYTISRSWDDIVQDIKKALA